AALHRRWSEMFEADIADILSEDGKHYKPITQWPRIWRQMLDSIDVRVIYQRSTDGERSNWDAIGEIVRLRFIRRKELGELLAQHRKVDAFVQRAEQHDLHLHLHAEIERKLDAARRRLAKRTEASTELKVNVIPEAPQPTPEEPRLPAVRA